MEKELPALEGGARLHGPTAPVPASPAAPLPSLTVRAAPGAPAAWLRGADGPLNCSFSWGTAALTRATLPQTTPSLDPADPQPGRGAPGPDLSGPVCGLDSPAHGDGARGWAHSRTLQCPPAASACASRSSCRWTGNSSWPRELDSAQRTPARARTVAQVRGSRQGARSQGGAAAGGAGREGAFPAELRVARSPRRPRALPRPRPLPVARPAPMAPRGRGARPLLRGRRARALPPRRRRLSVRRLLPGGPGPGRRHRARPQRPGSGPGGARARGAGAGLPGAPPTLLAWSVPGAQTRSRAPAGSRARPATCRRSRARKTWRLSWRPARAGCASTGRAL